MSGAVRPILQERYAFTVDELAMNPAEFGNLASRITSWKSQKLVLKQANACLSEPSRAII